MRSFSLRKACYGMLLLAMASCSENEYLEEAGNAMLNADIEAPEEFVSGLESRTFIDENDAYTSGVGTLWRTKEEIGVYGTSWGSEKKNVKFTSTNTKSAGTVSFSGGLLSSVTPKFAYYPYSATNNSSPSTAVKFSMPIYREYDNVRKDLAGDFRTGTIESRNWNSSTFTFNRLVALLRFKVNPTGTPLENSNIRTISMKVSNNHQISGDFTVDLNDKLITMGKFVPGNDSIMLRWSTEPVLRANQNVVGYATVMPSVKKGDVLSFVLTTNTHRVTFSRTINANFVANNLYTVTINLAEFDKYKIEELSTSSGSEDVEAVPLEDMKISSFKFEVAKNEGKILAAKVVGNGSAKPKYNANYYGNAVACTVNNDTKKITLNLPYLNNRKLVPTFEIPEGTILASETGEIISGETEVDFSQYKQVYVVNAAGEEVAYDVELTNSGLPVVVINQVTGVTSDEEDDEYSSASAAWYAATNAKWVPKDEDWQMTEGVDNFMVYNADGTPAITDKNGATLSEPLFSGTRLRGNVTQQMPKKSFAVKLDKKSGVLDMAPHKRWVLLANWKDRTLMRNAVAFGIAKKFKEVFPNDGLAWNPSGQYVELVYNGVHVGNYYLCEQIKIDGNRLDINDPYEEGDAFTAPEDYGYLLECDDAYDETWKFTTANYIPFLFKDDANQEMLDYATTFVRGIEDKLYAGNYTEAYKSMDLTSMVDFLLIQELMMNSEMKHPKSCYTYINDGKFYAGPIWDFDWNTLPTSSSNSEEGYSYTASMLTKASYSHKTYPTAPSSSDKNYMWYPMLVKNDTFKNLAAERWNAVKGALESFVSVEIPKIKDKIAVSEKVDSEMWPISIASSRYSKNDFGMGGGKCGDEGYTFEKAVSTLQSTLNTRISGMNTYVNKKTWTSTKTGWSW